MNAERGLEVIAVVVLHGADDAQVVNALTDVRQKIADLGAGLPVRPEVPLGSREILASRRRFSVIRDEFRLGIERIDVRDAAAHVQKDHSLGSGRKVRRPEGRIRSLEKPARLREAIADYHGGCIHSWNGRPWVLLNRYK